MSKTNRPAAPCKSTAIRAARLLVQGMVGEAFAEMASYPVRSLRASEFRALAGACREAKERYGVTVTTAELLA